MKNSILALLVIFIALGADAEVPDTLGPFGGSRVQPIWVSEASLTGDDEPQWELLTPGEEKRLRSRIRKIESYLEKDQLEGIDRKHDGCRIFSGGGSAPVKVDTLQEMVSSYRRIVAGVVVDVKAGLLEGKVNSLYELRVNTVLKGHEAGSTTELFFYPSGKISLLGQNLCSATRAPGEQPREGDLVVIFSGAEDGVGNHPGTPPVIVDGQIFWQGLEGSLVAPRMLGGQPGASRFNAMSDLLVELQGALVGQ